MMRVLALVAIMVVMAGCRSAPVKTAGPAGGAFDGTVPSADGVAIHYHVEGSGLPAVVFVHGWACDGSIWAGQVKAFSPRHTVATIDLAGHGQSGRDRATWSVASFAEDVRAVIDRLGLARVVLVGHSMSGYIILETTRLIPDRVAALVPVDTLQDADWKPGDGLDEWIGSFQKDFVSATLGFVREMFPGNADAALVERMATRMSAMPPDVGVAVLRAIFSFDQAAALARVKQPIRAINSDTYPTRLDVNRRYAPQFEAVIVTGTGHFPMLEKPAEFNRLLAGAIADLAG